MSIYQSVKKLSTKNRNNKFYYYLINALRYYLYPNVILRYRLNNKLDGRSIYDEVYIKSRVDYYNKLSSIKPMPEKMATAIRDYKIPKRRTVYFFDSYEYLRYFPLNYKFIILPGDIIYIPETPSLVKSRPINNDNQNSVVINLDKVRHFQFISDPRETASKINKLVWRGNVLDHQLHRLNFLKKYFHNPMCNVGKVAYKNNQDKAWLLDRLTINEQLEYKFILCLEGNDVATNLKWVMSSNSVAVMPKPKYETWFMEGCLEANVHYIEIKADYSDLEERLNYYIDNLKEVERIVHSANEYVNQFKCQVQEDIITLMVLQKYFQKTGQNSGA